MRNLTLENVAAAVEGKLVLRGSALEGASKAEAASVVIDSRKCESDCIFVATRGSRVDGHSFIGTAFDAGALGVICEKIPEDAENGTEGISCPSAADGSEQPGLEDRTRAYIVVEDSFAALRKLAAYYRTQMSDVKIVGIVGSVGKTSTKELVAAVLSEHYNVLKTDGNFNNEIGVPLTILRIRDEHEMAVVEMGISDFGEMDRLGAIVRPDAVVMTNIGPCHLEFLGDLDGVLRAKSEVFAHIAEGGFLLLNGEDGKLNTVKEYGSLKIRRFMRVTDSAAVPADTASYADDIVGYGLEGSEFDLHIGTDTCLHARVNLPGPHMVMNAVAAAAIGREFGLSDEEIVSGIAAAKPVSGRSNLIKTEKYLIVDDCYNANPKSMKAAIDMLQDASGRKVAILGDMFELGEDGPKLHAEVGQYAVSHGIDLLICVGGLSENMYREACKEDAGRGRVKYYAALDELIADLDSLGLAKDDTVLVKASHGMNFTKLLDALRG